MIRPTRGRVLLRVLGWDETPWLDDASSVIAMPPSVAGRKHTGFWEVLAVGNAVRTWSNKKKRWTEEACPVKVGDIVFTARYEQDRRNMIAGHAASMKWDILRGVVEKE